VVVTRGKTFSGQIVSPAFSLLSLSVPISRCLRRTSEHAAIHGDQSIRTGESKVERIVGGCQRNIFFLLYIKRKKDICCKMNIDDTTLILETKV